MLTVGEAHFLCHPRDLLCSEQCLERGHTQLVRCLQVIILESLVRKSWTELTLFECKRKVSWYQPLVILWVKVYYLQGPLHLPYRQVRSKALKAFNETNSTSSCVSFCMSGSSPRQRLPVPLPSQGEGAVQIKRLLVFSEAGMLLLQVPVEGVEFETK